MSKRFILLPVAAIAAAAALMAGCGDDEAEGEEVTVTTSSLSKPEYVKKAEVICVTADLKAAGSYQQLVGSDSKADDATLKKAVTTITIPYVEALASELEDLGAPEGDESEVEALLTTMREELDTASTRSPEQLLKGFRNYDEMAVDYGIPSCAFAFISKQ